ncbi:hypothetical protein BH10PSE7_BH10PSE7_30450 [soil metagenome]
MKPNQGSRKNRPAVEEPEGHFPAASSFGAISLEPIVKENESLLRELTAFDPLLLAGFFSGLLTEPTLQSNCIRLEALVHLSLASAHGSRAPPLRLVPQLFSAVGSGTLGLLEDPAEDVFVSLIITPRGNFRILEGAWESAGFFTQRIINALELIPDDSAYNQILDRVYALLQLSDLVCERANLARYSKGNPIPQEGVSQTVLSSLRELRARIRFSESELVERGISIVHLAAFGFDLAARIDLISDTIGHSSLERNPIAYRNEEFFLLLPTAVSAAIRRFALESMEILRLRDVFSCTLAYEMGAVLNRTPLLGALKGAPIQFQQTANGLLAGLLNTIDAGRFLSFVFFSDTLENFNNGGLIGAFPTTTRAGLEEDIESWIDDAHKFAQRTPGFREGITLLVGCGVGRGVFDLKPERRWEHWRVELISAPDLLTLSWLPDFKPLSLWRLLASQDRLEELGVTLININGLLNLVGWARSLDGHLVPHASVPAEFIDRDMPAAIFVEQNLVLKVRHDVAVARDAHACKTIDGTWVLVRKDASSIFDDDLCRPFYVSDEIEGRSPIAVFETCRRSWWIELVTSDETSGYWNAQRYQMLRTWICLAAPILDERFTTLPAGPILWRVIIEGEIGDKTGQNGKVFLTVNETLAFIEITIEPSIVNLRVRAGFEDAILNPANVAERALVTRLVEGVARLADIRLSNGARERIVSRIVLSPDARQSHAFMARNFRDFVARSAWSQPVKMESEDSAILKLGLGWRTHSPSDGTEIFGREACTNYLNGIVRLLEDEICSDLRVLDRRAVLTFALMNHEAAIVDRDNWRRTSSALVALHKNQATTLEKIAHHHANLNAIFQVTRLIVEFGICECPLKGGVIPGRLDMSRLMAKIMLTCGFGGWSDSMHWGAMQPFLRITPLGDIQANVTFHENVLNPYGRVVSDHITEESIRSYERNLLEPEVKTTDYTNIDREFLDAFEEQLGTSFDTARNFIDTVEDIGIKKDRIVFSMTRSEFLDAIVESRSIDIKTVAPLVDLLTLKNRTRWRDVPVGFLDKDIFPWRFRRRLSMLRRPLIQLDDSVDATLFIAPGILRNAFSYMVGNYHCGDFPLWQLKPKMKRWAGKARDNMGRRFSAEVAGRLRELGWEAETEVRVTKLLGKGFDQDYGDIDVLAWRREAKRVLLIECKDVQYKKTDGEIAEQLLDFRGGRDVAGKPDLLLRHLTRVEIISAHVPSVMKYLGLQERPNLEGHLVFKNPVPMKFAWDQLKKQISLHLFSELEAFKCDEAVGEVT